MEGGRECSLIPGSYIEYGIPFQLVASHFRMGFNGIRQSFGSCAASSFQDWKFEAFDGQEWRELYYSQASPYESGVVFPVSPRDAFASSRFRLRLAGFDGQCMHVRGLEVFGTILPPWRL